MGKRSGHFSKGDIQMADEYMKRNAKSLVIRERRIKATMSYSFTPNRIAVVRNKEQRRCW